MLRSDVTELQFITPIANIDSILDRGILCHRLADRVDHESVAHAQIQSKRASKQVPGGSPLHDYANLYFHARNPMMFLRKHLHSSLAVLCISPDVLDLAGVVITDQNAAGRFARFEAAPEGLTIVDQERTFADDWRDPDQIEYWRKKAAKCAEVLVPNRVPPRLIAGAHVSGEVGHTSLMGMDFPHPIHITPDLFFQESAP